MPSKLGNSVLIPAMLAGVIIGQWLQVPTAEGAGEKPGSSQDIACRSLEMRDDDGKPRIRLHFDDSGPRVSLYDASGKCRVQLGIDGDKPDDPKNDFANPYIAILDRKGGRDAEISSVPVADGMSSSGGLALRHSGGKTGIHARIAGNGGAVLSVGSDKSQAGMEVRWIPDSAALMVISGDDGDPLFGLGGKIKEKCSWIEVQTQEGTKRMGSTGGK